MGVESICDIPDDYDLTEIQRRAATCVQSGQPWFNREEINKELAKLEYPLASLTSRPSTRPYHGFRACGHTTMFRSSGVSTPSSEPGAEPEHYEFLAEDRTDPRRDFITSLCAVLGTGGT